MRVTHNNKPVIRLEIGTVVTQKCGYDLCTIGGNTASITTGRILVISLKLKNRDGIKK